MYGDIHYCPLAICVLTFAVKCTISLVETAGRTPTASDSGNNREQRPVSWTSYACKELDGTIIKDPKYPDFYFDLRIMCKMCMGSGKLSEHAVGRLVLEDNRCTSCYGTGHERTPIPKIDE